MSTKIINAPDLRVGNIVNIKGKKNNKGEKTTIKGLFNTPSESGYKYAVQADNMLDYLLEDVSGLPIGETQLMYWFGFDKNVIEDKSYLTLEVIDDNSNNRYFFSAIQDKNKFDNLTVVYTVNKIYSANHCFFVHELQNLFYYTIGKELRLL